MENGYDFKQFEVAVFFEAFNSSEYDIGHMGCAEAQYLVFWDNTPTAHIEDTYIDIQFPDVGGKYAEQLLTYLADVGGKYAEQLLTYLADVGGRVKIPESGKIQDVLAFANLAEDGNWTFVDHFIGEWETYQTKEYGDGIE